MKDRMTFIASTGGLCNRLRAFGACLTIAKYLDLDRTQLIWLPNESCPAEFEEMFVNQPNKWQPEISFRAGPTNKWCWGLDEIYYSSLVLNSIDCPSVVLNKLQEHYGFKLDRSSFHQLYCETIREQFIPKEMIRKKIWAFKDKYKLSERIGCQIRDNDDLYEWQMKRRNWSLDELEKVSENANRDFKKIIKNSEAAFLSIDNSETTRQFSNMENVVTYPKVWRDEGKLNWSKSRETMRIRYREEHKNVNKSRQEYQHFRMTDMEDAVVDLFLLSECKKLYITEERNLCSQSFN